MSRILNDRTSLDAALHDDTMVILVLSGSGGSAAEAVHNKALVEIIEPWRKTFLVENLALLSLDEANRWFGGKTEHYAVLGRAGKVVCQSGPTDDFMVAGRPSPIEIRYAFSAGE